MELNSTSEADKSSPKPEEKENVSQEAQQVVKEKEGKKAKGGLRFSLSTEKRYDEKSISEEELKKKRERLMHRRGTQYEYLMDGKSEKSKGEEQSKSKGEEQSKSKGEEQSKSTEDVLTKDQKISTHIKETLPNAAIINSKEESKQLETEESELETLAKKVSVDVTIE